MSNSFEPNPFEYKKPLIDDPEINPDLTESYKFDNFNLISYPESADSRNRISFNEITVRPVFDGSGLLSGQAKNRSSIYNDKFYNDKFTMSNGPDYGLGGYDQIYTSPYNDEQKRSQFAYKVSKAGMQTGIGEAITSIPAQSVKQNQLAAHQYRSSKMRIGALTDYLKAYAARTPVEVRKMLVDAFRESTQDNLKSAKLHRRLSPMLASIMGDNAERGNFMKAIDKAAAERSDELKIEASTSDGLDCDVLIIGAGAQGSVFANELRAQYPQGRIVIIDSQPQLGGQFRSYGSRPVFNINSRNHRPDSIGASALPGGGSNLNPFGETPLQITDFSTETYPSNLDLGDTIAVNGFLAADTMLTTTLDDIAKTDTGYTMTAYEGDDLSASYRINASKVVIASGLGRRQENFTSVDGVLSAEDVLKHFGNEANMFPMQDFKGKRLAIIGGGDSGRVVAELLTRLGPGNAYGRSSVQLGGPESIEWYGVKFTDKQTYCSNETRPRYQQLASFIGRDGFNFYSSLTIVPINKKVSNVVTSSGQIRVFTADTDRSGGIFSNSRLYDIVIDATNLQNQDMADLLGDRLGGQSVQFSAYNNDLFEKLEIARKYDDGVYVTGPAAGLALSNREKQSFAQGIRENTAAIWANTPRVRKLAAMIVSELRV